MMRTLEIYSVSNFQNIYTPLLGRQGPQGCILDSPGESGLVFRGKKGLRSPVKSRRVSLGAHCVA